MNYISDLVNANISRAETDEQTLGYESLSIAHTFPRVIKSIMY